MPHSQHTTASSLEGDLVWCRQMQVSHDEFRSFATHLSTAVDKVKEASSHIDNELADKLLCCRAIRYWRHGVIYRTGFWGDTTGMVTENLLLAGQRCLRGYFSRTFSPACRRVRPVGASRCQCFRRSRHMHHPDFRISQENASCPHSDASVRSTHLWLRATGQALLCAGQ